MLNTKNLNNDVLELLDSLYIGIRKISDDNVVKKASDLDGLECYLYHKLTSPDFDFCLPVPKNALDVLNISESEAWEVAESNTFGKTKIMSMLEMFYRKLGLPYTEELEIGNPHPMYVVTNEFMDRGASAICDKSALAYVGSKLHTNKFIVFPSSIHEMIIIPFNDEREISEATEMVKEVNNTHVKPEERLTDKAYIITI